MSLAELQGNDLEVADYLRSRNPTFSPGHDAILTATSGTRPCRNTVMLEQHLLYDSQRIDYWSTTRVWNAEGTRVRKCEYWHVSAA